MRGNIARAFLVCPFALLSGCPPVVHFEVCNNLGAEIVLHDGRDKKISPGISGYFMIPPTYLTEGTEIQLSIDDKKEKYYLKITDKQFYEQRAFSGRIKAQINPDGALYIMHKDSSCPDKELPDQPQDFPVHGVNINASNKALAVGRLAIARLR